MARSSRMVVVACVVLAAAAWVGGWGGPTGLEAQDGAVPGVPPDGPAGPVASAATSPPVPADAEVARVQRVVDGDTVRVRATGTGDLPAGVHRVRLIGIDTPEMHVDTGLPDCGAQAATDFLTALLDGKKVRLQADREDRDQYGRPLRYLWTRDGTFANGAVVAAGHAEAVLFAPNDRYWDALRAIEADARADGAGMWSACDR